MVLEVEVDVVTPEVVDVEVDVEVEVEVVEEVDVEVVDEVDVDEVDVEVVDEVDVEVVGGDTASVYVDRNALTEARDGHGTRFPCPGTGVSVEADP